MNANCTTCNARFTRTPSIFGITPHPTTEDRYDRKHTHPLQSRKAAGDAGVGDGPAVDSCSLQPHTLNQELNLSPNTAIISCRLLTP
jgi:hypothetical protein